MLTEQLHLLPDDSAAKKRGRKKRRPLDKYYTPDWMTRALLEEFPEIGGGLLFDPCCGDARMARRLQPRFDRLLLNDVAPEEAAEQLAPCTRLDACGDELWQQLPARPDWIVTNPPFAVWSAIAFRAVQHAARVAILLRSTCMEPCRDRQWLRRFEPSATLWLPRASFDGEGNDLSPCCWFLWGVAPRTIHWFRSSAQGELLDGGPESHP